MQQDPIYGGFNNVNNDFAHSPDTEVSSGGDQNIFSDHS